MKLTYIVNLVGIFTILGSFRCNDFVNNKRVFVEGKLTNGANKNIPVQIKAGNYLVVSSTLTNNEGSFSLGGPDYTDTLFVFVNKKIESFSVNITGCKLSYDSLGIQLPYDATYVKFHDIKLAP